MPSDFKEPEFPDLPAAPPSHVVGQGYHSHHTVPTTQAYADRRKEYDAQAQEYERQKAAVEERRERERREREEKGAGDSSASLVTATSGTAAGANGDSNGHGKQTNGNGKTDSPGPTATGKQAPKLDSHGKPIKSQGQQEKEEMMDRMNANQQKPTDRVKKGAHGERRVRDPVTGKDVVIKDANPDDFDMSKPAVKGSNVLLHPFPPATPPELHALEQKITLLGVAIAGGLTLVWVFTALGHGFWRFARVSVVCGAVGAGLVTVVSLVSRGLEKELERVRMDLHRSRGEVYSPPVPESVEWLNSLIKLMWGIVNPSMFVPIADMIEDIMQQSLPGFVDAVKISDLGQGTNPLRIMSIRALADQPGDAGYPKEHWIDQGDKEAKTKDTAGKELQEDQAGDYYNFEVAFAYQALPGQGQSLRSKNIHLLLEFFLGVYDWLHIPIPIWIQVESIYGVVRLRVQFIPEYPYVRNLTFTLCGVPSVEISAIPMSNKAPNVLDLPFVSYFVKMAIAAGTSTLCAPQSMTLNMQEMLGGATTGDTRAIGVFVVTIHYAENLSAQDNNGKSDPYLVLAYAKFGKPLYSTRIILGDLNPVWEETCVLLLTMDEVKSDEDVSAMLWDSDAHSADDLIGRIQMPVKELMKTPNKMIRREDGFSGFEDADNMPGKLHWSVGYFEKAPLKKELERQPTPEEAKAAPPPAKTAPAMEMRPDDQAPHPAKSDLPPPPPDLTKTRPDPEFPSGVLSVILHQVNNLERQDLKGKSGDREGEAGQDTDAPSEASDNLPSGYGEIIVNDDMVYKTRVKQYTTNPYFEAGTEVFVRDYMNTVVRVVIRDSRLREADPILGVVSVRLAEIFAQASSVTQTFAITEGVGFGKANISFAFRGMQTKFPPNMRGWETGTLSVDDVKVTIDDAADKGLIGSGSKGTKLTIRTSEHTEAIPKREAEVGSDGKSIAWTLDDVRIPVYARYASSVVFELGSVSSLKKLLPGVDAQPDAIAVLWLQDLSDDIEQLVKLPVLVGDDLGTLRQNAINDQTAEHHNFRVVGWLETRLKLDSGLDENHEEIIDTLPQARRHALQAYDRVEGEAEIAKKNSHANDDGVIDKKEKKSIEEAHKRQLIARGRGPAQIKAYRTAKWMKHGITSRLPGHSSKSREPTVQSEA